MPLLRPLDPAFPIDRQLAVDATPVVLVNLVTLDKGRCARHLCGLVRIAAAAKAVAAASL